MIRGRQLFDNLRFKVGIGILLPLALILGLFSYLQYVRHRALEISLLEQSATNLGQTVEGSLRHAMLGQDFAEVQQIIDDVAERGGIENIFLLNTQSEIRFAPRREGVGTRVPLNDPGCQSCHWLERQHLRYSTVVTTAAGRRVLRNCNPVENEPACTRCHDPRTRLNGVIITDLSMAEVDRHLAGNLRSTILLFGGALIAGVLTVNLLMSRMVVSRLARLAQAIKAFGQGDFSQRIAMKGGDEIARLAETFNRMAQGLQEKAGLEQKVTRQADELRRLSEERGYLLEKTITAQEEERKRIARELHDDFAQTLTALTIGLETALQTLPPEIAPLREQLARVQDLTTTTLGQTHRWIQDLRPRMLDDLGLVPAIRWYAETRLEAIGVQVQLEVSRFKGRLSPELETTLFRVIQEAINNVAKHAQARHVRIRLEFADARVLAEVEDDGVGFDPQAFLAVHEGTRGIGLLGMRERVTLVGGLLTVDSRPGRGTHIRIEVPWTA